MQPLIVAQQVTEGVCDFLRAAFPSSTPSFTGLIDRFVGETGNVVKGPFLTVPLPFRKHARMHGPSFGWLAPEFVPHAHQARAFGRLCGDDGRSTLVATGTGSGKTE